MESLPLKTPFMPIFYGPEDMALLEGSPFVSKLKKLKLEMFSDYLTIKKSVVAFKSISFGEFAYYRSLVSSRVFGFELEGVHTGGLVPLIGINYMNY